MDATNKKRFLLLYGSQTGQAKSIAEIIAEKATKAGLSPDMHCFSESEKGFQLEGEHVTVMVVSTTGEGEPPDTVAKFWRKLRRMSGTPLEQCQYALLGLGDSNYANFCNMGKCLNRKLLELGAKPFYPTGFADDAVGLDLVVEPWINGLWTPLADMLGMGAASHDHMVDSSASKQGTAQIEAGISMETTSNTVSVRHDQSASNMAATGSMVTSGASEPHPSVTLPSSLDVQSLSRDLQIMLSQPQTTSSSPPQPQTTSSSPPQPQTTSSSPPQPQTTSSSPPQPQTTSSSPPQPQTTSSSPPQPQTTSSSPPQPQTTSSSPPQPQTTSSSPPQPQTTSSSPPQSQTTVPSQAQEDGWHDLVSRLQGSCSEALKCARLSLPSLQTPWLAVEIEAPPSNDARDFPYHLVTYGVKSHVTMATIVGARTLTSADAVKKAMELEVRWEPHSGLTYQPGDAFGFVCPNCQEEVDFLMQRLDLLKVANSTVQISVRPEAKKKSTVLPQHIPAGCTVRHFFTHCADFRAVPKKAFLLMLSTHCSDPKEKRRLEELASKEGSEEYGQLMLEDRADVVDILHAFPSCVPPLERMMELLPRLQPRYYSAVSSPLVHPHSIKIAFNVTVLPRRAWSSPGGRFGLCTGWFDRIASGLGTSGVEVPLVPRLQNTFHAPLDPLIPVVMIGPGTGVAPFVGFLQHWRAQGKGAGPRWLFFGCRHPEKDYIYREDLEGYHGDGTLLHLSVTFSRLEPPVDEARYVHQEMRRKWEELGEWLLERGAVVYVCGDAKNMAKDIRAAILEVLVKYTTSKGGSKTAEDLLAGFVENGRYHVDAWS